MSDDEIIKLWNEACGTEYRSPFWETPNEVILKFKQLVIDQYEKEKRPTDKPRPPE